MDSVGMRPRAVHQRRWDDGRTLQRAPLGPEVEAAFGAPYYHFHRADLAKLLAGALPRERLHVGHKLIGLEQKGQRAIARFENGATAEADLLVAPTASIRACAVSSSVLKNLASQAALLGAGSCRPSASAVSASRWLRTAGWDRVAMSCTTGSRADE